MIDGEKERENERTTGEKERELSHLRDITGFDCLTNQLISLTTGM